MRHPEPTREIVRRAWRAGTVVPSFNIPYLPMLAPVVRALRDTRTFGLVAVARCEWTKFEAGGARAVRDEYAAVRDDRFCRLHLDHVPVIDEDDRQVDFARLIAEALDLGYESVMVDGSRLPLAANIAATRSVVELAGRRPGVAVEGELGSVLGHEAGPMPAYEDLFTSRRGFTDPDEAARFVRETGVDWLSVAIGNIHGAIAPARRAEAKTAARLDLAHLDRLREAAGIPLVLHGGSGIPPAMVREAVRRGIARINVATDIRRPYEQARAQSVSAAQDAVYDAVVRVVSEALGISGSADVLCQRIPGGGAQR